jgi:hypothetical protein
VKIFVIMLDYPHYPRDQVKLLLAAENAEMAWWIAQKWYPEATDVSVKSLSQQE